jgi:hypothetical protein
MSLRVGTLPEEIHIDEETNHMLVVSREWRREKKR